MFYRNIRARDLLEIFLVAAVSDVLLVRFYLYLTDYPQLGGGGLHIAHMLWGGLLMLVGIVLALAFLGKRAQRFAALIGGFGFGVFIDEIGKFITSDNDYFFQPAIGIIYAIFAALYLGFAHLARERTLTSKEYQLNALAGLEEALSHDMDEDEKEEARTMLSRADQDSPITKQLQMLFEGLETVPRQPKGRFDALVEMIGVHYKEFWLRRESSRIVRTFFIVEAMAIIVGVLGVFTSNVDDLIRLARGDGSDGTWLLAGEVGAAFVASLLAIKGAIMLTRSRLEAFEYFRLATLINLFLTDFLRFTRLEFAAMPGFIVNLLLITIITYATTQERRLQEKEVVQAGG